MYHCAVGSEFEIEIATPPNRAPETRRLELVFETCLGRLVTPVFLEEDRYDNH
jgi:hypothetical protein